MTGIIKEGYYTLLWGNFFIGKEVEILEEFGENDFICQVGDSKRIIPKRDLEIINSEY